LDVTQDRDGTLTQYYYDALNRPTVVVNVSLGLTTSNVFNAAGQVLQTLRVGSDGSRVTNSMAVYDLAGQLTAQTNALGGATTYAYGFDGAGHAVRTVTNPDGGQRVETSYNGTSS
jgi:YD repeat-containing protein